jgi:3-hydroxyacyl-[acyl-carrier-protein] dehydratase
MKMLLTMTDPRKVLPHRPPMLLLDKIGYSQDGEAVGEYTVKGDEFFLQGHFPDNPVVPGVILCEMMAQTCAALLQDVEGKTPFFSGIEKLRFRLPVRPGDQIDFSCRIIKSKGPFYFAKGRGKVLDKVCVEGEFSFALIENPSLTE